MLDGIADTYLGRTGASRKNMNYMPLPILCHGSSEPDYFKYQTRLAADHRRHESKTPLDSPVPP